MILICIQCCRGPRRTPSAACSARHRSEISSSAGTRHFEFCEEVDSPQHGVSALRIVFVIAAADLSGGIRAVATYARLLSGLGHEVTVVSTPPPSPSMRARVRSLLTGGTWPHAPQRAPSHREGAKAHFVQGDDAALPGQPEERIAATWRLPLHRIVCSRWLLELADTYGDATVSYVPNGVDLGHFRGPPRSKQERPTVGFVYSDTYNKGCDVALAAFDIAVRRAPALRLISFASAPVHKALPLPPTTKFFLRPHHSDIPRLYASCDAWLWPSRREGFGLPILEAMACGTPVIAATAGD